MEIVKIKGLERTPARKKGAKAIRKQGLVPCVIYGGDENIHVAVQPHELKPIVYTADFKKAEVTCNGNIYECILRDVQFHPITEEIVHVDFLRLVKGRKISVELPVRFTGTAEGQKEGGRLVERMRKVKIKTFPEHLIHELTLDITELTMGQSIRVRDIEIPDHMEVLNTPGTPVASVMTPRALKSATAAELEEGEEGEEIEGEETTTEEKTEE